MRSVLPLKIALIVGLAIGLGLAGWWWQTSVSETTTLSTSMPPQAGTTDIGKTEAPAAIDSGSGEPLPASTQGIDPSASATAVEPTTNTAGGPPSRVTRKSEQPSLEQHFRQAQRLSTSARRWNVAEYLKHSKDETDAESLFQQYHFLRSCLGAPRSASDLEQGMSRLDDWEQRDPDRFDPDAAERSLAWLERSYDRCTGMQQDIIAAAMSALEQAADLGFLPAQMEYISAIPEIMSYDNQSRERVFREPQLVVSYRERALAYLAQAETMPIADVWFRVAQVYRDGLFDPPDLIRAYAFYQAASRLRGLQDNTPWLGRQLSPPELDEAENLVDVICGRHC